MRLTARMASVDEPMLVNRTAFGDLKLPNQSVIDGIVGPEVIAITSWTPSAGVSNGRNAVVRTRSSEAKQRTVREVMARRISQGL